jgi:hypothetical protein
MAYDVGVTVAYTELHPLEPLDVVSDLDDSPQSTGTLRIGACCRRPHGRSPAGGGSVAWWRGMPYLGLRRWLGGVGCLIGTASVAWWRGMPYLGLRRWLRVGGLVGAVAPEPVVRGASLECDSRE